ncbi:Major Facilitator Superfamily protein [Sanguibacter gelidistatuariae]|uniref:Major Facilitator Superfamily protein n=1 Tax=Sanguibacter gelidistatuariae TaxID=1814289 RepID=A0A1G6LED9_9MICO|nr:MFS transporter [Sanguibacter gelidistatuariae]SDC40946.1 Major Facilitator Superfamily protein [Sanguibacter gelidistatuariae]
MTTARTSDAAQPTPTAQAPTATRRPAREPLGSTPILVGMIALVSLGAFEALAVSTAMPVIAEALDGLSLFATAFAITLATSVMGMVLAGRSTDRGGAGPALLGGVGVFVAGLLLAGLAPSMGVLIVGRALQGLGSGAYIVALYVVVARTFDGNARARVLAMFSAAWVIPSLVGPLVAGFVVEHAGWRWVFLSVAILAVPATALLASAVRSTSAQTLVLPDDAGDQGAAGSGRLWWAGAASAGIALMSLGSQNHALGGYAMIGAGAATVLVSGPRLLPRGTLRAARGLPTVIALRGLVAAAFFAAEVFLPLILQHDRGFSPARSGIILTAGAVTWSLGAILRSRLHWTNVTFLRAGTTLIAAGIVVVSLLVVPAVSPYTAIGGWALAGLGIGMVYPTLALLVFDLSPVRAQGTNTSALQVADALTSAFVLAIVGTATTWLVTAHGTTGYLGGFVLTAVLALTAVAISGRIAEKGV